MICLKWTSLDQLDEYLKTHPATGLVVIDTFQKIRGLGNSGETNYGHDYREVGVLKGLADKYGVCILIVHHTRKMKDVTDVFSNISGTLGITGAADTILVFEKTARNTAETVMHATGRDIDPQEITLELKDGKWGVTCSSISRQRKQRTTLCLFSII